MMLPIHKLINKILWDKREDPEDYILYYLDRISEKYKEIRFPNIKRVEGNFIVLEKDAEEVNIPLHRIKHVKKKDLIIWQR